MESASAILFQAIRKKDKEFLLGVKGDLSILTD
jgi:hypothetical protein